MQFNSIGFFVFALIFFAIWPLTSRKIKLRWTFLVIASFIFYAWSDWRNLFILVAVGLLNFSAGIWLDKEIQYRKYILIGALIGNIGILLCFKYSIFFIDNVQTLLSLGGLNFNLRSLLPDFTQRLPLGLSFYILQSISYIFDVFHKRIEPTYNLLHFFSYLALFPKLIAGPIERGGNLLPQLAQIKRIDEQQLWDGLRLIIQGYFLKVVIADNLAPIVDNAFSATALSGSSAYWWGIITAFAFQIYCDFNGYSKIALGLGKWMGFDLTDNFKFPYTSLSIGEFWRRWHISFSNWLRDYIFYPLSRSQLGKGRYHLNMWITMLISGLWHGAAWTFIIWGGLHALYISLERWTSWPRFVKKLSGGKWIALALVIFELWIAWAFFRANSIPQALQIISTMLAFKGNLHPGLGLNAYIYLGIGLCIEFYHFLFADRAIALPTVWANSLEIFSTAFLIVASVYLRGPGSQFIYFQF